MEQAERTTVTPRRDTQHATSALAAVANVAIDPTAWAHDVAAKPKWAVAFGCVVVLRFAGLVAFYRPNVSSGGVVAGLAFQVMTIAPALVGLAFLLWAAALVSKTRLSWPVAFAVTTHIYFAHALMTTAIASVAGALLPTAADVDLRAPPFTNLGELVSADNAILSAIASAIDVRSAYVLALATLAIRCAVPEAGWGRAWLAPVTCFAVVLAVTVLGAGYA